MVVSLVDMMSPQPSTLTIPAANPGLHFVLRENVFIRLCLTPAGVDKSRAGWEVIVRALPHFAQSNFRLT